MRFNVMLAALLMGLVATDALAQTPAPWLGTWKLNVAKSRFNPGPPPTSMTVTNTAAADGGYEQVTEVVTSSGKAMRFEFYAKPDGKDYPIKGPPNETIWVKVTDSPDSVWEVKKDGKVIQRGHTTYGRDGKTRTMTRTTIDGKGQEFESVLEFDRQ